MRKGLFIIFIVVFTVMFIPWGYCAAKSSNSSSVKITVNIHSVEELYNAFFNTAIQDERLLAEEQATDYFFSAISGSGRYNDFSLADRKKWLLPSTTTKDNNPNSNPKDFADHTKLQAGWYKFYWNSSYKSSSPSVSYSTSCSGVGKSYSFTFNNPQKVDLVIESEGAIMGSIYYTLGNSEEGQNPDAKRWEATDWYRASDNDGESAYPINNLKIRQSKTSKALEIISTGSAKSTTVDVYLTKEAFGIELSKDVFSGVFPSPNSDKTYEAPTANKNGYADSYDASGTYMTTESMENTWTRIQALVNDMLGTVKIISYFYYGVAFLTCVLMIIINIVKMAGAPNNPMMRTRIMLEMGMSFVCMALLGMTVLLTRLFILTCLG